MSNNKEAHLDKVLNLLKQGYRADQIDKILAEGKGKYEYVKQKGKDTEKITRTKMKEYDWVLNTQLCDEVPGKRRNRNDIKIGFHGKRLSAWLGVERIFIPHGFFYLQVKSSQAGVDRFISEGDDEILLQLAHDKILPINGLLPDEKFNSCLKDGLIKLNNFWREARTK